MSPLEMGRLLKVIEDAMIEARGENDAPKVAAAILGSYSVVPFAPLGAPPDWETPLIDSGERPRGNWIMGPVEQTEPFRHMYGCRCGQCPGEFPAKPIGHSWSCRCDKCDTQNRSVKP